MEDTNNLEKTKFSWGIFLKDIILVGLLIIGLLMLGSNIYAQEFDTSNLKHNEYTVRPIEVRDKPVSAIRPPKEPIAIEPEEVIVNNPRSSNGKTIKQIYKKKYGESYNKILEFNKKYVKDNMRTFWDKKKCMYGITENNPKVITKDYKMYRVLEYIKYC